MRFSFWPTPTQSWSEVLFLAKHVEKTGWDGFWYADHFMPNSTDLDVPINECWTVLAGIAAAVPRLRLGPLVTGNTYRHPAVLAKMAATVDQISGGRVVLGLGSGWQENEHKAYGIEFSTIPGRLARLDEACQVIRGLFSGDRTDFDGRYYQMRGAPLSPKPVQSPLPLLVGGGGEKVTLRITANYADEWNVWADVETLKHKMAVLDAHCEDLGRDPAEIKRSAQAMVFLSDDPAEVEKASSRPGLPVMAGNVEEVRDTVAAYAATGLDELIVPDFVMGPRERKLPMLDQFIKEVASVAR